MEVGYDKDLKAVYSIGLEENQSAAVLDHITSLGFGVVAVKEGVSLHVVDDARGTSHTIVFNKGRCERTAHRMPPKH
jgi:hypothetical protein